MSWLPTREPECTEDVAPRAVEMVIEGRPRSLGDITVRRVLPAPSRRHVGPFVFLDHMGPSVFAPGAGLDVRPHPHIHLATVTYLYEGEIEHRDSLGYFQPIRPGAVNWMTAGRGIVHSERTSPELRESGFSLDGIQLWVALPEAHQDVAPSFVHHPGEAFETLARDGAEIRVLAGTAFGVTAPVALLSSLFYADVKLLREGASVAVPEGYAERGAYLASGAVECGGERFEAGQLLVFAEGVPASLRALEESRLMLLGGEPLGHRFMDWNFISSSKERVEQAKRDWREGRFPKVPGDELEFIPLPE